MAERSTVPPRREAIIQQYTGAHEAACLAKDDAEKLQGWAEAAHDRRDFQGASHFWERCVRHTNDCKRHRERELELRKEEYSLYNHLDPENERAGLFKLIEYSERRIERLRSETSKRLVKSRIAHLKQYVIRQETKARSIERIIIEQDLRGKAKGRSNIAFGNGWDGSGDGWGLRQPHRRDLHGSDQSQAASRLRYLEGQQKYALQQADRSVDEIKQNEEEWEEIREQERIRDENWVQLDRDARKHWAGLPAKEYEAAALIAIGNRKRKRDAARQAEEEAYRLQKEKVKQQQRELAKRAEEQHIQDEAKRKAAEEQTRLEAAETEEQWQRQADEQARWEEEYALEEDPEFM